MDKYNCDFIDNLADLNSSHTQILKKIAKESIVLEFGPARGVFSEYMKNKLGCTIYAVEIDEASALQAQKFCADILIDNIENYHWKSKFNHLQFDYIIFADVLEHLYNPWLVLKEVKKFLKPAGKVLFSLPNIAHNSIIMNLLKNEFNYQKLGLLDNTHIRFFTKQTIDNMILECGYRATTISATFIEPHNTEFKNKYSDFGFSTRAVLFSREYRHVYQFIYEIVHKENMNVAPVVENLYEKLSYIRTLKLFIRYIAPRLFDMIRELKMFLVKSKSE